MPPQPALLPVPLIYGRSDMYYRGACGNTSQAGVETVMDGLLKDGCRVLLASIFFSEWLLW